MQIKAIESVFYHHPQAHVKIWVTEMSNKPIQPFLDKGYNVTLYQIDLKNEIKSLLTYPQINRTIVQGFLDTWDQHEKSKFWTVNKSNLLRLVKMYCEGGIYLGTCVLLIISLRKKCDIILRIVCCCHVPLHLLIHAFPLSSDPSNLK